MEKFLHSIWETSNKKLDTWVWILYWSGKYQQKALNMYEITQSMWWMWKERSRTETLTMHIFNKVEMKKGQEEGSAKEIGEKPQKPRGN